MNKTYETILSLTLRHNYYNNELTGDFTIMPTAATKSFLENSRLVFRNTKYGFAIDCDDLFMNDDMIPDTEILSRILNEKTLSFTLKLKNTDFMNFTDLDPLSGGKNIYYLHNLPGDKILVMDVVPIRPPVFTYQFETVDGINELQVQDMGSNVVISETLIDISSPQISISVNLEGYASGLYNFTANGQSENIYITNESPGNGIFGIAEITFETLESDDLGAYEFQFNAKSSVWEYHLLFVRDYDPATYSFIINDRGEIYSFGEETTPDYSKDSISVFASEDVIPYHEDPITGLQLVVEGDMTNNTFNDLPNPSVSNPESKVYLTI